jgi:hypothetical protein
MHEAMSSPHSAVKVGAVEGSSALVEGDVAVQSVFYALFRIVELAEYAGPETAIEWAQSVLGERRLLHGFVERVRELSAADAQERGSIAA